MPARDRKIVETIRLSDTEKNRVVSDLDKSTSQAPVASDKRELRIGYRPGNDVQVVIHHLYGQPVRYKVVPRNLSTGGIAFLHGQFVHPNSICVVFLPTLGQSSLTEVPGKIVRCRYISGMLHEIAVQFTQPIDLSRHAPLTTQQLEHVRRQQDFVTVVSDPKAPKQ